MSGKRIVVVGGGLLGHACAVRLLQRGHHVHLIERPVANAIASTAAAGMLAAHSENEDDGPFFDLCVRGAASTLELADELRAHGHTPGDVRAGTLSVAPTGSGHRLARAQVWQAARGHSSSLWSPEQVHAHIGLRGHEGWWCGGDHRIDPRMYLAALRVFADALGLQRTTSEVRRVAAREVTIGAEVVRCDEVLVCAGAWTSLVEGSGVAQGDVFPVRGQIVALNATLPSAATVRALGVYLVGYDRDGTSQVLLGATVERAGFAADVSADHTKRLVDEATSLFPHLADASISDVWVGLRPGSADDLPLLGRSHTGVWVASGHYRNGVLLAAASADFMANAIEDPERDGHENPFSPRRFDAARRSD
jgi:glycine oxidase